MSTEGQHATAAFAQLLDMLGEPVVHWPGGDERRKETITAIVDRTEQSPGLAKMDGKTTHHAVLTMRRSVVVTESQDQDRKSRFVIDGRLWFAVSVTSADDGCQEVSVESSVLGYTQAKR